MRPSQTFQKRQRELARQEKQREKAKRKLQRKLEKQSPAADIAGESSDTGGSSGLPADPAEPEAKPVF